MALPDFTTQDNTTYKTNIDGTADDHETRISSNETKTGYFQNVNGTVSATDEEMDYLSGATSGTALTTGDEGSGGGIDADTLDSVELDDVIEFADSESSASSSIFDVDANVTQLAWESVGPTGSGADNIFTELDNVPSDANWVELQINHEVDNSSGSSVSSYVYARKNGSSLGTGTQTTISRAYAEAGGATSAAVKNITFCKVQVSANNIFDIHWINLGDSESINIALAGWGY